MEESELREAFEAMSPEDRQNMTWDEAVDKGLLAFFSFFCMFDGNVTIG